MLLDEFPGVARIDPKHIGIHEMAAHKCAVVKALCELPGRVRNMYESSEGVQPSVASARDDEAESSAPDASSSSEEEEDVEASDGVSSDGSDEEAGSRESSASDGSSSSAKDEEDAQVQASGGSGGARHFTDAHIFCSA